MRKNNSTSLQQYLRNRLIIFGLLMTLVYGYAMSSLYSRGLDDASEFYLFQDAETAEALIAEGLPLPADRLNRKFFLGFESLPSEYHSTIDPTENAPMVYHIERGDRFDYLLSYPLTKNKLHERKTTLFVVHTFDLEEDKTVPGFTTFEITLALSMTALAFVLITASLIYRSIINAVDTLYHWGNRIENADLTISNDEIPLNSLRFSELQSVGNKLSHAINHIISITKREKSFVRCLSHELRTPMAVTSAALDILEKKGTAIEIQTKVEKIRNANSKMISISDTLLTIWQEQQPCYTLTNVNVFNLATEAIQENRYVAANADIQIFNNIDPTLVVKLSAEPFAMILTNLIKNALQYTHSGFIKLSFKNNTLVVTNSYALNAEKSNSADYGYGIGLFIAETIAKQQRWSLDFGLEGDEFHSSLDCATEETSTQ